MRGERAQGGPRRATTTMTSGGRRRRERGEPLAGLVQSLPFLRAARLGYGDGGSRTRRGQQGARVVRSRAVGKAFGSSPSSHLYLSHHPSPARAILLRDVYIICLACHKAQHAKLLRLAFCRRRLTPARSSPAAWPRNQSLRRRRSVLAGDFTAAMPPE